VWSNCQRGADTFPRPSRLFHRGYCALQNDQGDAVAVVVGNASDFSEGAALEQRAPRTNDAIVRQPVIGYTADFFTGAVTPVLGPPMTINGLRLVDGKASVGLGLETFALGFPIHFDWSWRTLLNKGWEDYVYSYDALLDGYSSGSKWFRKPKFSIWIGYDF